LMRSLLFVPGDSPRKLARALQTAAGGLIIDLEDSVAPDAKANARAQAAEMLAQDRGDKTLLVRINALDTGLALADLAAVMPHAPSGIMLPKCDGPDQVRQLAHMLDALEAAFGLRPGSTFILPIATETAGSLFRLGDYRGCSDRLWGLMWGSEDLSASLGASANREGGTLPHPHQLARTLCLAGAAAAEVVAVDAVALDIDDLDALAEASQRSRRDGFGAKAVIHPKHVDIVNAAFLPSDQEISWAKRIIEAFSAGRQGVATLDGQMIDKPHLRAAERILASVGIAGQTT
jgi:citrate lyase subunit beta / citryl-CoA lyase